MTDLAIDRRVVKIGDTEIAVHVEGCGGPPIVLLHGFGAAIETWMMVLAPLAEHHRVVAFDRPGFGASPLPPAGPRRDRVLRGDGEVEMVLELLDVLGDERAVLMGHSAGGAIAAAVAIDAPERVAGLVLVDAAIGPGLAAPASARHLAANPIVARVGAAITRVVAPRVIGPAMIAIHRPGNTVRPELVESYRRDLAGPTWAETVFALATHEPLDPSGQLDQICCPTLVMTGSADHVVSPRHAIALADQIPEARLVVFPGAGHSPHEERPAEFVAAVQPLLSVVRAHAAADARATPCDTATTEHAPRQEHAMQPAFADADALRATQTWLGGLQQAPWHPPSGRLRVAGCVVAFARGEQGPGRAGDHAWVGAAVLDEDGDVLAGAVKTGVTAAPYVPGLLGLREGQLLLDGIVAVLASAPHLVPDVVMVDATGRDHPRRGGLALHLGQLWDLPTVGVTHRLLCARHLEPPALTERGETAPIVIDGQLIAAWCCTRSGARPVVAHAAWRTDVADAVEVVLRMSHGSRTPEPLRVARRLARQARSEGASHAGEQVATPPTR